MHPSGPEMCSPATLSTNRATSLRGTVVRAQPRESRMANNPNEPRCQYGLQIEVDTDDGMTEVYFCPVFNRDEARRRAFWGVGKLRAELRRDGDRSTVTLVSRIVKGDTQ